MPKSKVKIEQPDPPVQKTVLAQAIMKISQAAEGLMQSGLNQRAIVVLLSDRSGRSKTDCKYILDCLAELKEDYCK